MNIEAWKAMVAEIDSAAPLVRDEVARELAKRVNEEDFAPTTGLASAVIRPQMIVNGVVEEIAEAGLVEMVSDRIVKLVLA